MNMKISSIGFYKANYNTSFASRNKSIYAVDKNDNYVKFDSKKDAAKEFGYTDSAFYGALRRSPEICGYTILYVNDVEVPRGRRMENVDKNKIEAYKKMQNNRTIYVLNSNGTAEKFENRQIASKNVGMSAKDISYHITCNSMTQKGQTFAREVDLLSEDEKGEYVFNLDKLNELFKRTNRMAVYVIDKDDNISRFSTMKEAAKQLGISYSNLYRCISYNEYQTCGYTFIKANEIEHLDEDLNLVVDDINQYLIDKGLREDTSDLTQFQRLKKMIELVE